MKSFLKKKILLVKNLTEEANVNDIVKDQENVSTMMKLDLIEKADCCWPSPLDSAVVD